MTHEDIKKQSIRKRAEAIIDSKNTQVSNQLQTLSFSESQKIVHELKVHQIELEMQNEDLLSIQKELHRTKKRYFDLYEMAPVSYCTLNQDGIIQEVNLATSDLLGIDANELINQPLTNFIFQEDQDAYYLYRKKSMTSNEKEEHELRMTKADKTPFWVHLTALAEINTKEEALLRLVINDISERKLFEESLRNIAHFDQLTKLPNRVLLADRLENGMIQTKRNKQYLAVVFLDIDGFKEVNDTHGHDVGDKLLVMLAEEMKLALREGDTLARFGGDEFVSVLFDLAEIEDALPIITRLLEATSKRVEIDDIWIQVSASLGVTFHPQAEMVDADQLLRQADQAMYQAKLAGKNKYHIFNMQENALVRERFEAREEIRKALNNEEFILYFQPKINMRTGEVIGSEALIRWQHPIKGFLAPLTFLPVVEGHSLSIEIGEWVIDTALAEIKLFQEIGIDIPISVNIGAHQLLEDGFVDYLTSVLLRYPTVSPSKLELEVLETSRLEDIERAKNVMNACINLGITFALDDFGTGYSSLTYLKQLPIKQVKIDQSFVRNMLNDPNDLSILEGVLSLSKAFNRTVIAEGVETSEHATTLLGLGCEFGQGYEIARPMPGINFINWFKKYKPNTLWKNYDLMNINQRELLFVKVQHRAWIINIKVLLNKEDNISYGIQSIYECTFGKWLERSGKKYLGTTYEEIYSKHKQIHTFAEELLELHHNGRTEEALDGLNGLYILSDELLLKLV